MTTSLALDRHPVLACVDEIETALKRVTDVRPGFMAAEEKREALLRLSTLTGQLEALRLRMVVACDDVAEHSACRTVADWLAARTRADRPACARTERLARALDQRWTQVGAALVDGRVSVAQAEVIVAALDALPGEVDRDLAVQAEARLVADAAHFAPPPSAASAPRPRPASASGAAATAPPTSKPGSPMPWLAGSAPTSRRSPHPGRPTPAARRSPTGWTP